jgi:hypothetical protein
VLRIEPRDARLDPLGLRSLTREANAIVLARIKRRALDPRCARRLT